MLSHGILPGFRNVGRVIENCWNEVEERRTWKSEAECKSITSVRFCGSVFPGGGYISIYPVQENQRWSYVKLKISWLLNVQVSVEIWFAADSGKVLSYPIGCVYLCVCLCIVAKRLNRSNWFLGKGEDRRQLLCTIWESNRPTESETSPQLGIGLKNFGWLAIS